MANTGFGPPVISHNQITLKLILNGRKICIAEPDTRFCIAHPPHAFIYFSEAKFIPNIYT